ncbi:hypothetical protein CMI48_03800 [Candidatus Pacearchaeota archaeon]|nr:hypothetical protein [Candidatus Pacearchaeota archaeon]|tara:strand:+ start:407 stop:886 length:480 start_codon:yes stop_codon:yes gene_type:complete
MQSIDDLRAEKAKRTPLDERIGAAVEERILAPIYRFGKLVAQMNAKVVAGALTLPTQVRKWSDGIHYIQRADREDVSAVENCDRYNPEFLCSDTATAATSLLLLAEGVLGAGYTFSELAFQGNGAPLKNTIGAFVLANLASGAYEGVRALRARGQTVSE